MRTNRYREAFKENANLAGLAGAFALSAALLNPLPLLLGVAAEVAYMLFVPDTKWYESRLAKRFDAEVEARRRQLKEKVFPTLRPEVQERFLRLESIRVQVNAQSQDEQHWFREVLRKLDYLLEKFLLFASKEAQFRNYLQSLIEEVRGASPGRSAFYNLEGMVSGSPKMQHDRDRNRRSPEAKEDALEKDSPLDGNDPRIQSMLEEVQRFYNREREKVGALLEKEQDQDTHAILEKRADVLQRRQEFAGKIGRILANLNHQLRLVEETFGLINDEIRARSPEQILADIDEVVLATESMTQTLEELSSYEQMVTRFAE